MSSAVHRRETCDIVTVQDAGGGLGFSLSEINRRSLLGDDQIECNRPGFKISLKMEKMMSCIVLAQC